MKQVSGNLWFTTEKDETRIGFTRSFIAERLSECFHVLPADTKNVKEKGPLLVLETNDGLEPVCSPVTGRLTYFNEKARNFPDRLTEEDCIVSLSSKELTKVVKTLSFDNYVVQGAQQFNFNIPPAGAWAAAEGVHAQAAPPLPQAARPRNLPALEPEPRPPVREAGEQINHWNTRLNIWLRQRDEIRQRNRDRITGHQQLLAQQDAMNAQANQQRPEAVPPQRRVVRNRPIPRADAWMIDDVEGE